MRTTLLLLTALVAGCTPPSGAVPRTKENSSEDVLRSALSLRFRYHQAKRGDSLLYLLRKPDGTEEMTKISAVGEAGTLLWIEEKILSAGADGRNPLIRKTLLDREGIPKEIWTGRPQGGPPVRLWPPRIEKHDLPPGVTRKTPEKVESPEEPSRREPSPVVFREIQKGEMTRGADRVYTCTLLTWTMTRPGQPDLLGMDWLSPDLPFDIRYPWEKTYGGLVRRVVIPRRGEEYTIELISSGTEASQELPLK